eukprot:gnl/TRDRNA2_/TRDRNA2_144549_c1_seq1.p1 gnl/TRDRNA2_/TRDRNA2_144549_c1~~gnl/TRDRNA2_/TRDRNA2_144549_c1_seq1.p1  ORF type:complete len:202 (+),score=32.19 gnl/TRDRNA2_/TRDRNA2_144549_c1_seq1:174-779(+)
MHIVVMCNGGTEPNRIGAWKAARLSIYLCFFCNHFQHGHGISDARDLVGLVHASRENIRLKRIYRTEPPVSKARKSARDLIEESKGNSELLPILQWDLHTFEIYRAAWMKTVVDGLRSAQMILSAIKRILAYITPSVSEVASAVEAASQSSQKQWAKDIGADVIISYIEDQEDQYTMNLNTSRAAKKAAKKQEKMRRDYTT